MEEESCGVHSDDDKTHHDKNKKRIVKTRAQIEALEKFYDEHKYPSEPMKIQLADSIGLTEKQVSGWFCHRRLKDKKLLNGETHAVGRQDRSSGVIQDRGSGHRQDSCGSTKQGDDRNCDTREVESGRLNLQEFPAADITCERGSKYIGNYDRVDDATSGSSSSLRNMPSHHNGDPFDVATSRSLPKFPLEVKGVKGRPGPSGYLTAKGRIENSAITAVKRQLGKHFREDGPPLGVEFDPLPPGAFESSTHNPVDEALYSGEPVLPASPGISKTRQHPRFGEGYDYKLSTAFCDSSISRAKMMHGSDASESYVPRKFRQKMFYANNSTDHSADMPESYAKNISRFESKIDYRARSRQGVEVVTTDSASNHHHLRPYGMKVEGEQTELWPHRSNDVGLILSERDDSEGELDNIAIKGNKYHNFMDKGPNRQIMKGGRFYGERRAMNRNSEPVQVEIPIKDMSAPKRMGQIYTHQQYQNRSLHVDNQP